MLQPELVVVPLLIPFITVPLPNATVGFNVAVIASMLPIFLYSLVLLGIIVFATVGSIVGFTDGGYESTVVIMVKSALGILLGAELAGFFVGVSKTSELNIDGFAIGTLDGNLLGRIEGVVDDEVKGFEFFEDIIKGAFEIGIFCGFGNVGPCEESST